MKVKDGEMLSSLSEVKDYLNLAVNMDLKLMNEEFVTSCNCVFKESSTLELLKNVLMTFTEEWDRKCQNMVINAIDAGVSERVKLLAGYIDFSEGNRLY